MRVGYPPRRMLWRGQPSAGPGRSTARYQLPCRDWRDRGTGNTHARRLLVEAAWHHRPRYRVGATLQARWQRAPAAARARGHEGNLRLAQRWLAFADRHKRPVIANVAIARELAGWCWSLATLPD